MELFTCPITLDVLENPVLASDGETYSEAALVQAMQADPWHRSPVTGEVLRRVAYPNTFVAALLIGQNTNLDCKVPTSGVELFAARSLPPDGRLVTWTVPALLSAKDTLVRRKFGLPDEAFSVTAAIKRDSSTGLDWLMHPPAYAQARADILDLARLLGVQHSVQNPWCLTLAKLDTGKTVEDIWTAAHYKAPAGRLHEPKPPSPQQRKKK
jgi:hypothetical protein